MKIINIYEAKFDSRLPAKYFLDFLQCAFYLKTNELNPENTNTLTALQIENDYYQIEVYQSTQLEKNTFYEFVVDGNRSDFEKVAVDFSKDITDRNYKLLYYAGDNQKLYKVERKIELTDASDVSNHMFFAKSTARANKIKKELKKLDHDFKKEDKEFKERIGINFKK